MLRLMVTAVIAAAILVAANVPAFATRNDIVGTWQGVLMGEPPPVHRVLKISRDAGGTLRGIMYSPDETDAPIHPRSIRLDGSQLTIQIDMNSDPWLDYHRTYRATMSADGQTLTGRWYTPGLAPGQMNFRRVTNTAALWRIPSVPIQHFVTVQPNVKLETLDWGGTGRPVVLLAGLGNTAHAFYKFANDLKAKYRVYGITRRGFGASSKPVPTAGNYSVDRLADDVIAVIDALKIDKPVLVGHSIAGEELSDIGKRYPQKVAALVYLEAGYGYSLYDPKHGFLYLDAMAVQHALANLAFGPPREKAQLDDLLGIQLPRLQRGLQSEKTLADALPADLPKDPNEATELAVLHGEQIFQPPIDRPILAIFALPHDLSILSGADPKKRAAAAAAFDADTAAQVSYFKHALPAARVIILPHANHFVFLSNEADVLRAVNAFIGGLPNSP
ncbi:MAG TPA: alpha/beta hydrolase [Candidatus Baltobacteraceae bacterium]|jgi:pimeloyl-ACP methyl ester carboxylesterase